MTSGDALGRTVREARSRTRRLRVRSARRETRPSAAGTSRRARARGVARRPPGSPTSTSPLVGPDQSRGRLDRRRLARPVRAEQRDDLAARASSSVSDFDGLDVAESLRERAEGNHDGLVGRGRAAGRQHDSSPPPSTDAGRGQARSARAARRVRRVASARRRAPAAAPADARRRPPSARAPETSVRRAPSTSRREPLREQIRRGQVAAQVVEDVRQPVRLVARRRRRRDRASCRPTSSCRRTRCRCAGRRAAAARGCR